MGIFAFRAYEARNYPPFAVEYGVLSEPEVREVVAIGASLPNEIAAMAGVGDDGIDMSHRKSRVAWMRRENATEFLFVKLAEAVQRLNDEFYGFDLIGFTEKLQFTEYEGPDGGYEWHSDIVETRSELPRKLSMTLQLTDGGAYEGGDVEFRDGTHVTTGARDLAALLVFPSWGQHRVTQVTSGTRRSLVAWFGGPPFR